MPAGGGTGSTGVTSPAGCAWTGVSNNTSWLTVTGGASGSGSGTVAFSAAANSSTSSRTGTLTIAGQSFSVTQPGINCTYAIAPTSGSVAGRWRHRLDGRDVAGRVCVDRREQQHILADGHGWRERQRQRHGGVQRGGQQQHQSAHGHADDCWTELQRDAAGHRLHVYALCHERLGPGRWRHGFDGRDVAGRVRVDGVSNSTSWLTVTGGASGSGSGTVAFSAAANSSTSSRTGTLTIAGQSFSVTQPGIACTYYALAGERLGARRGAAQVRRA